MNLSGFCATHVGLVRSSNEDNFLADIPHGVFGVFDGMGGHEHGEVAAKLATDTFAEVFACSRKHTRGKMDEAFVAANQAIFRKGGGGYRGMGTTAVVLAFGAKRAYLGWSGDSRCYRLRDGRLEQLTRDHGVPNTHQVTKCLGTGVADFYEVMVLQPRRGDMYLLTSDGLTCGVSDAKILALLQSGGDLAQVLVNAANDAGGMDNTTCVVVEVE